MNDKIKEYLSPGKKNLIMIYVLYLGIIIPIAPLPLIGGVLAFLNKDHPNPVWKSHYIYAFRTFVFGVIGSIVAIITTFIFIGPILYMLLFVWFIVRSIVAVQFILEDLAHPNPLTIWIK